MNPLDEARLAINEIDRQMAALFEQRMAAVTKIVAYKRQEGLPVLDRSRETALLERNCSYLQNPEFLCAYQDFFAAVLAASRAYQAELLNQE